MLICRHLVYQCLHHMQFYTLQVTTVAYLYDSALFLHINLFTKKDIDLFFAHTDSSSCGVSEQVWHSGFKALKEVGVRKAPEVEIIRVDIVPLPRRLGRQLATQRCGRTRLLLQDCGCTSLCFIFPRDIIIIIIIIIIIKCKIPRKALLNVDLFLIFLCWLALSIGFDWSWLWNCLGSNHNCGLLEGLQYLQTLVCWCQMQHQVGFLAQESILMHFVHMTYCIHDPYVVAATFKHVKMMIVPDVWYSRW